MKTGARRARASGRHLPQLGLHPDQGAAALVRGQPPAAHARRLRLHAPRTSASTSRRSSSARARSPASSRPASSFLMKKNKVTVFDGHGKLAGAGKVTVAKDGKPVADLTAKHIILATGARARALPGLEPDGKLIWTYARRWCRRRCRSRCWSSAPAPSASSSPASTATSAPR